MQTPRKILVGTVVTVVTVIVCILGIRAELSDARKAGPVLSSNQEQNPDSD